MPTRLRNVKPNWSHVIEAGILHTQEGTILHMLRRLIEV